MKMTKDGGMLSIMVLKSLVFAAVIAGTPISWSAEPIKEIQKQIKALNNEAKQLKKNYIFIWGEKQENMTEKQKCASSRYNINILTKGKDLRKYKSPKVIALNPEYVCPIHKCIYVGDHCPKMPGCKSETRIGTGNLGNMGAEYDLSYRTWLLLKDKMADAEAQENRLKEIEVEIESLKARQKELHDEQVAEMRAKRKKSAK